MYLLLTLLFPFGLSAAPALPSGNPVGVTDTVRGVPIRLVQVAGDTFQMGCFGRGDEAPIHPVLLQSFWISETEVTVAQYEAFVKATGHPPVAQAGPADHPALHVSHDDALAYCAWLSNASGQVYRLPTEAEWEFAAGGGRHTRYPGTDTLERLPAFGWFMANSGNAVHPVRQRQPNALGLYDMGGNAAEWCADWYHSGYTPFLQKSPHGPATGQTRVVRGGSWRSDAALCLTTDRAAFAPDFRSDDIGFRVVRE